MENLKDIIKNLKEVLSSEKVEVTGNCLFENAVKIFISNNINDSINKKESSINNKLPNELPKEQQPATENQKFFLKKVNKYQEGLTKLEAGKIISEYKREIKVGDNGNKDKWKH